MPKDIFTAFFFSLCVYVGILFGVFSKGKNSGFNFSGHGSETGKKLAEERTEIFSGELPPDRFSFFKAGVPLRLICGQFFCQGHEDMKQSIQGNYQRGGEELSYCCK